METDGIRKTRTEPEVTMGRPNQFRQQIYGCGCERCRALVSLVEGSGARVQVSPERAGRLCELAVVAASGTNGLDEADVVAARRAYARHLGIDLSGPTSNSDDPVHIGWAIENSNHNRYAKNRINLGKARASIANERYRLV